MPDLLRHNCSPNQTTSTFHYICKLHLPLLALVFFLLQSLTYANEFKENKRVLILFPNQSDLPAYPVVEKGIKSKLAEGTEFHIEYYIEYMDWYRNADQTYRQMLIDLYHRKFSKHNIDLVIAGFATSLNFVTEYREKLFPKTPIVFSGVPRVQIERLALSPMDTGILGDIDYTGLLETALKIHPQTRHVVVINGASPQHDLFFEDEIRKALAPYAKRFDLIYLMRLPMGQILEKVQNLPGHSVILFYFFTQDGDGMGLPPWEAASMVADTANTPVYGCLDSYLGHGIVGGRMFSMEMMGIKTGEMALRILRGENPSDIPMTSQGAIVDLFDWRQFKRFNIREDRLPPGSNVRFKTYSVWELYHGYIVAVLVFIMVQSGLITFLLKQRAQRRRAQEQLSERLQFEETLAELSARFVNLPPDRVNQEIKAVLESIGKILHVDRLSVFEIFIADEKLRLVHSQEGAGIAQPPYEIQFKQIPWIIKKIVNNELLTLSNPEDLPAEAELDRFFVRSQGAVSFLIIPLTTGEKTLGVLNLAMLRHRKSWSQELVRQCRLVAEVITNALLRKQHEESLSKAEHKYRTVADFTYDWEYWENTDNSIEYISPSCERITGYAVQDFMDNPSLMGEIIVPEDRGAWDSHFHDSRQKLMPGEMQFRIQRRDGEIRWIEHNCQPVIDAGGHLQGFRASNRDITTRKQGEELLKQNQQDLSRLAGRIISTQEEELRRLSREIHDDLTQRIASLALDAALIEKQINPSKSRAVEDIKGLRKNLSEVADQVHDLSRRLHPSVLDDLGLVLAVQAESAAFKRKTEIDLSITIDGLPDSVHPQPALCLYRVIQEGLQNIAKHSGATLASITLQGLSNGIRLLIEDEGVGFDSQEVRKKAGIGLSSMRERVQLLNGTISFASQPGQGTKIEAFIPTEEAP